MESWRMLVVPERSFGGFWHNWYPKDTLRKLYINFHISTCLGIDPSPICLHRVIMESKRTLMVPERSLGGFWHNGCTKDTLRKLYINFYISTCLGIAPSPMCLQRVIMESKRTLVVPERSLGGFWHNGCTKDTLRKLYINFHIFTCLGSGQTPVFSRKSSKCLPWSLGGCWWFLRGVLVVFDIMDVPRIH